MKSENTRRYLASLAALAATSGLVQAAPVASASAATPAAGKAGVTSQAHAALSRAAALNLRMLWCQFTWGQNVTCFNPASPDAAPAVADESLAAILRQS